MSKPNGGDLAVAVSNVGGGFGGRNPFGLAYPVREPVDGDGGGDDGTSVVGNALEIDDAGGGASRHNGQFEDQLTTNRAARSQQGGGTTVDQNALHISASSGAMSDEEDNAQAPQADDLPPDQQADATEQPPAQPQQIQEEVRQTAQFFQQQMQRQQQEFQTQFQQVQAQNQELAKQNQMLTQKLTGFFDAAQQRMQQQERAQRMPQRPPPDAPPEDHYRYELAMHQMRSGEVLAQTQAEVKALRQAMVEDAQNRERMHQEAQQRAQQQAWDAAYDSQRSKIRNAANYQPWLGASQFQYRDEKTGQAVTQSRGEVFFDIIFQEYCRTAGQVVDSAAVANEINSWIREAAKALANPAAAPQQRQQVQQQQRAQQQQRPTGRVSPAGGAPKRASGQQQQGTQHANLRQKFFANPFGMNGDDGARILPS